MWLLFQQSKFANRILWPGNPLPTLGTVQATLPYQTGSLRLLEAITSSASLDAQACLHCCAEACTPRCWTSRTLPTAAFEWAQRVLCKCCRLSGDVLLWFLLQCVMRLRLQHQPLLCHPGTMQLDPVRHVVCRLQGFDAIDVLAVMTVWIL